MRVVLLLATVLGALAQDDVQGCGGFVRPPAAKGAGNTDMNMTPVKVKLLSASGAVKAETECAPNGYYYMPTYDAGPHVLKVEGPLGWIFDTETRKVDSCEDGRDIDFAVTRFALAGRVLTLGDSDGPSGVTLKLSGKSREFKAKTGAGGHYSFDDAPAGAYTLTASHASYKFKTSSVQVEIAQGAAGISETFGVLGYDVTGSVTYPRALAAEGVPLLMKPLDGSARPASAQCTLSASAKAAGAWCSTVSGAKGGYTFEGSPAGKFSISVDFADASSAAYESVSDVQADVAHAHAVASGKMELSGFSLSGKVVDSAGAGVAGADVTVNGAKVATTDATGTYTLKTVPGTYTIEAKKEGLSFEPLKKYQISAALRRIGSVSSDMVTLCGAVSVTDAKISKKGLSVTIEGPRGQKGGSAKTDANGEYCWLGRPGDYKVRLAAVEGAVFAPASRTCSTKAGAMKGCDFAQESLDVSGSIGHQDIDALRAAVGKVKVVLKQGSKIVRETLMNEGGGFEIKDILPGEYTVQPVFPGWCWGEGDKGRKVVKIGQEAASGMMFIALGHEVEAYSDRDADLTLKNTTGPFTQVISVSKGTQTLCVKKQGNFQIIATQCSQVAVPHLTIPTSGRVDLSPSRFAFVAAVESAQEIPGLQMHFSATRGGEKRDVTVAMTRGTGAARTRYTAVLWVGEDEEVVASPRSDAMENLFTPETESRKVQASRLMCPRDADVIFQAEKGVMVSGVVSPPTPGVLVRVMPKGAASGSQAVATGVTSADGAYSIGPLQGARKDFSVEAVKEGFEFTQDAAGNLVSVRMGEVPVYVSGSDGALEAAFLSLSSSSGFRQNNRTTADGSFTFKSLAPGDYFLRPALKEYEFSPASASLSVAEGSNAPVKFKGSRVSFSCFGSVTLLDGNPEAQVVVEAVSVSDATIREEAVSEADGTFRIRGLTPGKYKVGLKADAPKHEHSVPREVEITMGKADSKGAVSLMAFRRPQRLTLAGRVAAVQEHLVSVTVEVALASNPGVVIKTVSLSAGDYFEFADMARDAYFVKAVTSLDSRVFVIENPAVKVELRHYGQEVSVPMTARPRNSDQAAKATSFIYLVFAVAMALLVTNREEMLRLSRGAQDSKSK